MQLVVIRHAKAEDRNLLHSDSTRSLMPEGRERMTTVSMKLKTLVDTIDLIVSSPYKRTLQTAEILHKFYPVAKLTTNDNFQPGCTPEEYRKELAQLSSHPVVAVIGHEPDLGKMCSWFLASSRESFINFKKSGVCILDFPTVVAPQSCQLVLKMDPKHFS